nr:PREDICTED: SLIT-ROBO Rho GTPase-activating protein 1-like isoform X2 [Bemisia tabaci]
MDEDDCNSPASNIKSPIKRLGSTRKFIFFNNIRLQLQEQLRCLETRMDTQVSLVLELQDFFRRRAEVELDYSKNLDKLLKNIQLRHTEQKQKREQWSMFSSYSCWQQLVTQTKNLSHDHAALSKVYSTHLTSRLSQVIEDLQRIYRRCREIGLEIHEEILRVLHELYTTMKTYQAYQTECKQAETKLKLAETQRHKIEQSIPKDKLEKSKKFRIIEKEVQKRKNKYFDAKLKALKARNEYILNLEASNTTIHKYFVDDLSDLIDCMDFGFHHCISRALCMHVSSEEGRIRSIQQGVDAMNSCILGMDSRLDKQKFLEFNHAAFMIPKKFEFQGQKDELAEPELQRLLCADMEHRLIQLKQRLTSLRTESDEVWKTLETAESTLLDMLTAKDYNCSGYFGENAVPASKPPETFSIKLRADRHETEEFYLTKLQEYILGSSRIARLNAKHEYLRQTLIENSSIGANSSPSLNHSINNVDLCKSGTTMIPLLPPSVKPQRRKRIGRFQMNGQPKLFGGSLEEYVESTNQEVPLIVKSCIRVINLFGLHHQGIFRVSGSQVEINNFKDAFERGEDPLADMTDASDINSVAGVLKLYLRELREPLFPIIYFEQFMELAQLESKHEFILKMKDLIASLPRSVVIVMRYIFAFLNHLSEYSDENMMDPYNLAICFGPTLVPVPEDKDQVQYQNQVNELIKNIILFHEDIFPGKEFNGLMYEKYISREPDDTDVGDSPSEHMAEDMDSEIYPSEDESLEATAQFDFCARSDRELSLRKGDCVTLFTQVSNDWWKGSVNGQQGLIPDKYISLKMKDEDKEKFELLKSSSSDESVRRRASSSNDSVLSATSASGSHSPSIESHSSKSQVVIMMEASQEDSNAEVPIVSLEETDVPETVDIAQSEVAESGMIKPAVALSTESPAGDIDKSDPSAHPETESPSLGDHSSDEQMKEICDIRQKHTPDLVMDLPFVSVTSSSPKYESSPVGGPESPDMSTVADRFAKQNQCTLKKNTKAHSSNSESINVDPGAELCTEGSETKESIRPEPMKKPMVGNKPKIMAKPQILKKPFSSSLGIKKDC